ncbi:DUF4247 domain-containing protein [Radiobacillus sp. PE A8.2]|uniref:DUF4247 domain-containing protein n=1 Tax=Radiobacillus sp. PE A8.2 TaxID=3380349 RepID=UPI00388E1964
MPMKMLGLSIVLLLILSACGPSGFTNSSGAFEDPGVSVDMIPDEPTKQELTENIQQTATNDIEAVIANNFELLDVVQGEDAIANVYATRQFSVSEIVSVISEAIEPDEISDLKNNQQILIYPNHFVTFKVSEEDADVVLMEVATEQFVRDNYSPSFLQTYFAFRLLDSVLGVPNWGSSRSNKCANGGCYGGYSTSKPYNQGSLNTNRGMSDYRGGGPSAGK